MDRNRKDNIAYFIAFCVEVYKKAHGMSGGDAFSLFAKYDVIPFLSEHFDVLHTQNYKWILAEVDNFINTRTK